MSRAGAASAEYYFSVENSFGTWTQSSLNGNDQMTKVALKKVSRFRIFSTHLESAAAQRSTSRQQQFALYGTSSPHPPPLGESQVVPIYWVSPPIGNKEVLPINYNSLLLFSCFSKVIQVFSLTT